MAEFLSNFRTRARQDELAPGAGARPAPESMPNTPPSPPGGARDRVAGSLPDSGTAALGECLQDDSDSIFGPVLVTSADPMELDVPRMRAKLMGEEHDSIFGPTIKSLSMPFSQRMRQPFLAELRRHAIVTLALRNLNLNRDEVYGVRYREEAFRQEWDAAILQGIDAQEDEAARRAFQGVDKPIFYLGQQVATVKEYSDTLAMFILRGARPEKYRERYDVSGKTEIDVKLQNASDEELNRMILEGLSRVGVRIRPRETIDVTPGK